MLQDGGNNAGQPLPALSFSLELKAALCAQPVKLCVAASLGRTPFGDQKTLVFQAMKCGVQRALLDLQRIFRDHLDALRNRISVNRSERDDTKNEQVQRSLGKVEFGWSRHTCFFYIYTTMCRRERCDLTSGPAKPLSVPKSEPPGPKNRLFGHVPQVSTSELAVTYSFTSTSRKRSQARSLPGSTGWNGVALAVGFGLLAAGVSVNAYFMRPLGRWRTKDLIDFGIVASSSE